jgi:hypothetical protein
MKTRDEFLDDFLKASGMPASARTPDGIKEGAFERVAVPCPDNDVVGHAHYLGGDRLECPGWILARRAKPQRGGEYTVRTHG